MLDNLSTNTLRHAKLKTFDLMRPRILTGERLRDVKLLQNSILRFGLLSPIIAIERAGRLIVVDGRKRLAAIRRLGFQGRLPRSLVRIPYVRLRDRETHERVSPRLLANRDLYLAVKSRFENGVSTDDMAQHFQITRQCIRDLLSLSCLSPIIRDAFFDRLISFAQARAYASLPKDGSQIERLRAYGPFARVQDIMEPRRADGSAIAA